MVNKTKEIKDKGILSFLSPGLRNFFNEAGEVSKFAIRFFKEVFYPPYEFRIANMLVSNFHLPKSSLLIMVSAFTGHELLNEAYEIAIKEKYRFYSYGDSMMVI